MISSSAIFAPEREQIHTHTHARTRTGSFRAASFLSSFIFDFEQRHFYEQIHFYERADFYE
jgi:hypothetical protein